MTMLILSNQKDVDTYKFLNSLIANMDTRSMSTQEISNKLIPQNYLHTLLQPDIVTYSKLPAPLNVPSTDLLPSGSLLLVNPPNLDQVT